MSKDNLRIKMARRDLDNAFSAAHRGDLEIAKAWIEQADERIEEVIEGQ